MNANLFGWLVVGARGAEKQISARAAYEGLMDFVQQLQSVPPKLRHLRHVYFVDIDKNMTDAMASEMKSHRRNRNTGSRVTDASYM